MDPSQRYFPYPEWAKIFPVKVQQAKYVQQKMSAELKRETHSVTTNASSWF